MPVLSAQLQAQREARQQWYAAMRDAPEVWMRLYALDVWAQQPGEGLDPLSYALVDEDEQVRQRGQELYAEELAREAAQATELP